MSGDTNTSLSLLSASCEQSMDSNLLCTDMGSSMPFCSRPIPLLFVLGLTVACLRAFLLLVFLLLMVYLLFPFSYLCYFVAELCYSLLVWHLVWHHLLVSLRQWG